jgi:GTP pyrophosphokinase
MITKAIEFAKKWHEGQTRRDGSPYISHPLAVASIVSTYKDSKNLTLLIVSAILHDIIEDTPVNYAKLAAEFGVDVAIIVDELTINESLKIKYGKKEYLAKKMLMMSNYALVIKLADRMHNLYDVHTTDEEFKKHYIEQTKYIIGVLEDFRSLTRTQQSLVNAIKKLIGSENG